MGQQAVNKIGPPSLLVLGVALLAWAVGWSLHDVARPGASEVAAEAVPNNLQRLIHAQDAPPDRRPEFRPVTDQEREARYLAWVRAQEPLGARVTRWATSPRRMADMIPLGVLGAALAAVGVAWGRRAGG